ncbi:hypothetical protein PR048_014188 [Dryococelus australis]|uniref:Uncharacterized protein n=1 Tax=Dryococelus australis TaxID=614101 RepID=A0ABQ9HDX1_9NEOP|nr:hypothetical protein PR048_014188 [Dryococelus australis]
MSLKTNCNSFSVFVILSSSSVTGHLDAGSCLADSTFSAQVRTPCMSWGAARRTYHLQYLCVGDGINEKTNCDDATRCLGTPRYSLLDLPFACHSKQSIDFPLPLSYNCFVLRFHSFVQDAKQRERNIMKEQQANETYLNQVDLDFGMWDVADLAVGLWVFSRYSGFPCPCILLLLHPHLIRSSLVLKNFLFNTDQNLSSHVKPINCVCGTFVEQDVCVWAVGNLASGGNASWKILRSQGVLEKLLQLLTTSDDKLTSSIVYSLTHYVNAGLNMMHHMLADNESRAYRVDASSTDNYRHCPLKSRNVFVHSRLRNCIIHGATDMPEQEQLVGRDAAGGQHPSQNVVTTARASWRGDTYVNKPLDREIRNGGIVHNPNLNNPCEEVPKRNSTVPSALRPEEGRGAPVFIRLQQGSSCHPFQGSLHKLSRSQTRVVHLLDLLPTPENPTGKPKVSHDGDIVRSQRRFQQPEVSRCPHQFYLPTSSFLQSPW